MRIIIATVAGLVLAAAIVAFLEVHSHNNIGDQFVVSRLMQVQNSSRDDTKVKSATDIYKNVSPSIFLIDTLDGGGTGFCIEQSGVIATSLHVIDGAKTVAFKSIDHTQSFTDIDLLLTDKKNDLAILKANGLRCSPVVIGDDTTVSAGQKIFVIGNPLASQELTASITDGIISGIRDLEGKGKVIQISAPISPGNSGGPVLNEFGQVVGIVAFKLKIGESLNFAVPVTYLVEMYPQSDVAHPIFSWHSNNDTAFSSGVKISDDVDRIFIAAEHASNTCRMNDATYTSKVTRQNDGKVFALKGIQRRDFASVHIELDNTPDGVVAASEGISLNGRWTKLGNKVERYPLTEDDFINHIVDNWWCFCPEIKSLWVNSTVQEQSVNGRALLQVKATDSMFGETVTFWFDNDTKLLVGRQYVNKGRLGPKVIIDTFSDFRTVGNYTVPFKTIKSVDGNVAIIEDQQFYADTGYPEYVFEP